MSQLAAEKRPGSGAELLYLLEKCGSPANALNAGCDLVTADPSATAEQVIDALKAAGIVSDSTLQLAKSQFGELGKVAVAANVAAMIEQLIDRVENLIQYDLNFWVDDEVPMANPVLIERERAQMHDEICEVGKALAYQLPLLGENPVPVSWAMDCVSNEEIKHVDAMSRWGNTRPELRDLAYQIRANTSGANGPTPCPIVPSPSDNATLRVPAERSEEGVPPPVEPENSIQRIGDNWEICFGKERGHYVNKCVGQLAKILSHPNRNQSVADLLDDPEGKLKGDAALCHEQDTGAEGVRSIKHRLEEIYAIEAETGGSEFLGAEKVKLTRKLQEATRYIPSALTKAHHNVASQIRQLMAKLKTDMPKLAEHLRSSLQMEKPDFGYYPNQQITWKI